jgi:NitT/TauT family transport system substrate-binding protein
MKRILALFLSALLLSACVSKPLDLTSLSIMSPKGAPALSLIPLLQEDVDSIELVDGADLLSSELIKGEKDLIIAPVYLGANIVSKGSTNYVLYGIVTWGNLYIVGSEVQAAIYPLELAAFGDQAVPGLVLESLHPEDYKKSYFNAVSDVQAQLLAQKFTLGMLAEPLASATLAKASQNNLKLVIVEDLQATWFEKTGYDNYPQAALFVKRDISEESLKQVEDRFTKMQTFILTVSEDSTELKNSIETLGADVLGVPSADLVLTAWDRMNIELIKAEDVKETIEAFLELFKLEDLQNLYE